MDKSIQKPPHPRSRKASELLNKKLHSAKTLADVAARVADCRYTIHCAKMNLVSAESDLKSWLIGHNRFDLLKVDKGALHRWLNNKEKATTQAEYRELAK